MAAHLFSRLDPFDCQKGDFGYYLEQFDNFLNLNSVQDESKKVPLFISSIGQDTYKILKEICAPSDPKEKSFGQLKCLLLEYFARREFYCRNQRPEECTEAYVNELKRISLKCNFGPFAHDALRDRIACGKLPEATPSSAVPKTKAKTMAVNVANISTAINSGNVQKQPKEPKNQKGGAAGSGIVKQRKRKCKICGDEHNQTDCPHKDEAHNKDKVALVCRAKPKKIQQHQQLQPVQVLVHVKQNTAVKN